MVCVGSSLPLLVAGRVLAQFGARVVDSASSATPKTEAPAWAEAGIVLVDRVAGAADLPGLPAGTARDYLDFVARHNRSVWVTASAYGLSTSRADAVGSDLTVLSSAGILGHSRIGEEWAPTIPAGSIGLKVVGEVMALAALHGLHARLADGESIHVASRRRQRSSRPGLTLEMAHALLDCPDEGGSARYGAPTGFFQCRDGAVYVVVLEQHQWTGFQRTLAPALDSVEYRRGGPPPVQRSEPGPGGVGRHPDSRGVRALPASRRGGVHRGQLGGRPDGALAYGRTAGGVVRPRRTVGASYCHRSRPRSASGLQGYGYVPLDRMRILDAGHVLSCPPRYSLAGGHGRRGDQARRPAALGRVPPGPSQGVPGLNRSAYFNAINFCKQPLDVSVTSAGSSLDLRGFDVVVHNLSPRRAAQVGVDGATVIATDEPKLSVTSSGFGSTGDWANYRAYGHNIHAFAGLVAATRNARGEMADVGTPWCDPLTSVAIATWISAWSLAPAISSVG